MKLSPLQKHGRDDLLEILKTEPRYVTALREAVNKTLSEWGEWITGEFKAIREEIAAVRKIPGPAGETPSNERLEQLMRPIIEDAIPDPIPGAPGKDAEVTPELLESIVERVRSRIPLPQQAQKPVSKEEIVKELLKSPQLTKKIKKLMPTIEVPEIPALEGIVQLALEALIEEMNARDEKARTWLENKVAELRSASALGGMRGGGDTVVAGPGVTITENQNGNKVIAATGGGGVTIETPSGMVNATNTVFTPTAEPSWVVADGIQYFDGAGYTWNGTTITMDVPPSQYIRAAV